MLLTELLDLPIHDHQGEGSSGSPMCASASPTPIPLAAEGRRVRRRRVARILVSPHQRSSYLGFEHTDVHAPVLLARWIR